MKKKIGNQNVLYPTPVTIVGALVNGKIIVSLLEKCYFTLALCIDGLE